MSTTRLTCEELLARALELPRDERARVARALLSSLQDSGQDDQDGDGENEQAVAAAWAEEIECRSREVAEGKVETVEWRVAQPAILEELRARRASV